VHDAGAQVGANRPVRQQINVSPQSSHQLTLEGHDGHQARAPREFNEEINVTGGRGLAARHRAKNADAADAMAAADFDQPIHIEREDNRFGAHTLDYAPGWQALSTGVDV